MKAETRDPSFVSFKSRVQTALFSAPPIGIHATLGAIGLIIFLLGFFLLLLSVLFLV